MSTKKHSPLILVNAVGMTSALLTFAPRLRGLSTAGWNVALKEVTPSVTCTAQATILTGQPPSQHGIVGNGWLFRDTMEVRFWQQSSHLLNAEPIHATACRRAALQSRGFRCAKLFWWFNQGADVAMSVTPKPHYGADGNKVFGITGTPDGLTERLERELGTFPFHTFWGPFAGLPCTQWIAHSAACLLRDELPDLTLVYLPHLDYDPQRFGPSGCPMPKLVEELDASMAPLLDVAKRVGARVWVVSEYGHVDVRLAVEPNRALRRAGLLSVRPGPFGEVLDTFGSRAFAVCDHQLAHVYVRDPEDEPRAMESLRSLPGIARLVRGDDRGDLGLLHSRSGEIIALSAPDAWFAYPFWLDDCHAPDYARTVDIHRKPGYDPCELFLDPSLLWPRGRVIRRLMQKKLGFRTLFDVIPLNPSIVKGSHGLPATDPKYMPILIGDGPRPSEQILPMSSVHDLVLDALGLGAGD